MNLLNPQHFITPLTEKRNLVTIILIAAFFGVFRLAGGSVYTTDIAVQQSGAVIDRSFSDPRSLNSLSPGNDLELLGGNTTNNHEATSSVRSRREVPNPFDRGDSKRESFGDMLRRRTDTDDSSSRRTGTSEKRDGNLDNIEKMLGLR